MSGLLLLGYVLVLGGFGHRAVAGRAWARRAPRAGLGVWIGLIAALIGAVVALGAAVTVQMVPVSADVAAVLRACVLALRERYATPGGAALAGVGLTVVGVWLGRLGWCVQRALYLAARARRRLSALLEVLGDPDPALGAVIVSHSATTAYSLAGRPGTVVLNSAVRDALSREELLAVLAHERAHLRGRHHLLVALAAGVSRAFPRIPLLGAARGEVAELVELAADDVAARRAGRLTVGAALVRLAGAGGRAPAAALAAAGQHTVGRVQRLLRPPRKLGRAQQAVLLAAVALALVAPTVLALAPALAGAHPAVCPFGVPYGSGPCRPV